MEIQHPIENIEVSKSGSWWIAKCKHYTFVAQGKECGEEAIDNLKKSIDIQEEYDSKNEIEPWSKHKRLPEPTHGLLAVFIEWMEDGHEKFEYIGLYTNDTSELYMRDIKKVAEHLELDKYEVYAVLSHPNIPTIMFEDEEESVMEQRVKNFKSDVNHIQLESRGEITESEVDKMNESISTMLKNVNHEPPSEEDAKAILKDAERL